MKLKNLFYLMLAVPMVFAACSKSGDVVEPTPEPTPEPDVEYVVDAEMTHAMRVREIEVGDWVSPDNQFLLAFSDENENHTFTVFFIGELEDTTLQAGTYTSEDENVDMTFTSYAYVADDENEDLEPVQFAEATVVVAVERLVQHPLYKKPVKNTQRFKAHDENNECKLGDTVAMMETRPLSKDKRWRVTEILERAK